MASSELDITNFTINNADESVALMIGDESWPVILKQGKIKGGIAFDFPEEFIGWGSLLNELELDGVKSK